jgi:hypothetical protein
MQRLKVVSILWKGSKQRTSHPERAIAPLPLVMWPVDLLCAQHTGAVGIYFGLTVEMPNASKRAHLIILSPSRVVS